MKLSENTMSVLKNFAAINTAIFFKQGNVVRTISPFKTVLAVATIDETLPSDFGVFDLNQLLSILSLHPDSPEVHVKDSNLVIQGYGGRSKITYRCCAESMIKVPPPSNIKLPSIDAAFELSEADLDWSLRAAGVLASPNISIFSDGGYLFMRSLDAVDNSAHTETLQIGDYTGSPVSFLFKTENWKMLPGTYEVEISLQGDKGAAHFKNKSRKLEYWIALEAPKK